MPKVKHSHGHWHRVPHPHAYGHFLIVHHAHEHGHDRAHPFVDVDSVARAGTATKYADPDHRPHAHTPEEAQFLRDAHKG